MLDLNEFAKEVHAVAVAHGWWDGEENNDIDTKIALIHAEWSEALEEYRAGRPMVWHACLECGDVCEGESCGEWADGGCELDEMAKKPEGIAVELVDGCIRILDLMAARELDVKATVYSDRKRSTLPQLVAHLHNLTAKGGCYIDDWDVEKAAVMLMACIRNVKDWLDVRGVDFEELMRIKHEFNKTRSYRHGGKRC